MSSHDQMLAAAGIGTKYKNVQWAGTGNLSQPAQPAPPPKPPKRINSEGMSSPTPGDQPVSVGIDRSASSPPSKKGPPPPPPPRRPPMVATSESSPSGSAPPGQATPSSKKPNFFTGLIKRASVSTKSLSSDGTSDTFNLPSRPYSVGAEDSSKRLLELEEMLDHEESLTSRVLLREGTLEKLNRDKYTAYHFILTTDALIYCSVASGGGKLKLKRTFPLSAVLVVPSEPERPGSEAEFKLLTTIKSFYVRCEGLPARNCWFSEIESAASAMHKSVGKTPNREQMAPCLTAGVSTMFRRLSTQASGIKLDCHVNKVYSSHEDNSKRLLELEEMLDHEESLTSRVLLREGTLEKLNRDKFSTYHFILTTDALIYSTPNVLGDKMKHNRTLSLSSLLVGRGDPSRPKAEQEFKVMTPPKSFVVQTASAAEANSWLEDIQAAASSAHRRAGTVPDIASMAPLWETDATADGCTICHDLFTMLNRRHHCRNCGALVCDLCSKEKLRTKIDDQRLQRVCTRCAEELKSNRKYGVDAYA